MAGGRIVATALLATSLCTAGAGAQTYPSKPIKVVVPYTPGSPVDVLTGFVNRLGEAQGRPAGAAFDRSGALLVADDVGNAVWRVTPAVPKPTP